MSGIINNYTVKPRNLTQYTAFRGVTDFTQIGQFAQYETGYSFLSVLDMPKFMVHEQCPQEVKNMSKSFQHMLEYEFRGLDGLPDISASTMEISDGINTQNLINRVTQETSVTISSTYYEKQGSLITKFSEYYLTGIKDKMSQAKTYHGLIKNNYLEPGPENEVFTMMYYVTDNTMLRLEKAYLLCNCQLTKAETSMYNSNRSDINNKEMTIEWTCFPITGEEVDRAAWKLLQDITNTSYTYSGDAVTKPTFANANSSSKGIATLDSSSYSYKIMNGTAGGNSTPYVKSLVDALK